MRTMYTDLNKCIGLSYPFSKGFGRNLFKSLKYYIRLYSLKKTTSYTVNMSFYTLISVLLVGNSGVVGSVLYLMVMGVEGGRRKARPGRETGSPLLTRQEIVTPNQNGHKNDTLTLVYVN